jgi:hypothetical protein
LERWQFGGGGYSLVVKCLSSIHKALGLICSTTKWINKYLYEKDMAICTEKY